MVRHSFFRDLALDHRTLGDLVMKIRVTREPDDVAELAAALDFTLRRHFEVEDTELFPTLLDAVDDWEDRAILLGAHEDHRLIVQLLDELVEMSPPDERFHGKVHCLDKLWQHHYEEEENALHDMARDYLDPEEFEALRKRIRAAEKARRREVPEGYGERRWTRLAERGQ